MKNVENVLPKYRFKSNLQFHAGDNPVDEKAPAEAENTDPVENPDVKTIPYDRFKQVNDKAKQFEQAFADLGIADIDALKALHADLEAKKTADAERERAEMTEIERLKADLETKSTAETALTQQLADYKAQVQQERIQNDFIKKAQAEKIEYVDAALKLADLSAIKVDDDGIISGTEELVKELVKQNPFLLSAKKKQPEEIGDPSNPASDEVKTLQQQLEDAKKKKNFSLVVELSNKIKGLVTK